MSRIGGLCRDGTYTTATGRGAGSHHGGIAKWIHGSSGSTSSGYSGSSYSGSSYSGSYSGSYSSPSYSSRSNDSNCCAIIIVLAIFAIPLYFIIANFSWILSIIGSIFSFFFDILLWILQILGTIFVYLLYILAFGCVVALFIYYLPNIIKKSEQIYIKYQQWAQKRRERQQRQRRKRLRHQAKMRKEEEERLQKLKQDQAKKKWRFEQEQRRLKLEQEERQRKQQQILQTRKLEQEKMKLRMEQEERQRKDEEERQRKSKMEQEEKQRKDQEERQRKEQEERQRKDEEERQRKSKMEQEEKQRKDQEERQRKDEEERQRKSKMEQEEKQKKDQEERQRKDEEERQRKSKMEQEEKQRTDQEEKIKAKLAQKDVLQKKNIEMIRNLQGKIKEGSQNHESEMSNLSQEQKKIVQNWQLQIKSLELKCQQTLEEKQKLQSQDKSAKINIMTKITQMAAEIKEIKMKMSAFEQEKDKILFSAKNRSDVHKKEGIDNLSLEEEIQQVHKELESLLQIHRRSIEMTTSRVLVQEVSFEKGHEVPAKQSVEKLQSPNNSEPNEVVKNPEQVSSDEEECQASELRETEESGNSQKKNSLWSRMGKGVFCLMVVYALSLVLRAAQLSNAFVEIPQGNM